MKIYLVRHGETQYNKDRIIMGQLDIPLNETGKIQSKKVAKELKDKEIKRIYSSDLSRTIETAKIINKELNVEIETSQALREHTLGKLDGITVSAFLDQYRSVLDFESAILPEGGEKIDHFRDRVWGKFQEIVQSNKEKGDILIVTHGGCTRAIFQEILDANDIIFDNLKQDNCCINIISLKENSNNFNYVIELINSCKHLV